MPYAKHLFNTMPAMMAILSDRVSTPASAIDDADQELLRHAVAIDVAPRYEVINFINAGSFASVWHAIDTATGDHVAIKQLNNIQRARRDFYSELSILFRLSHPAVVRLLNIIDAPSQSMYLVLEYCPRGSLRQLIRQSLKQQRRWSEQEVARLMIQIAQGLQLAHELGIIHSDLKPENVLVGDQVVDSTDVPVKIADFGLSRRGLEPNRVLGRRMLVGSPAYMAPEQFAGDCLAASDLYSLGVIGYELLQGRRPFEGEFDELARGHCYQYPDYSSHLSPAYKGLLQSLMAKDATNRPTAREAIVALQPLAIDLSRALTTRALGLRAHSIFTRGTASQEVLVQTDAGISSFRDDGTVQAPVVTGDVRCMAVDPLGRCWFARRRHLYQQESSHDPLFSSSLPFTPDHMIVTVNQQSNTTITCLKSRTLSRWRIPLGQPDWICSFDGELQSPLFHIDDDWVGILTRDSEYRLLLTNGHLTRRRSLFAPCRSLVSNQRGQMAILTNEIRPRVDRGSLDGPWCRCESVGDPILAIAFIPQHQTLLGVTHDILVEWNETGAIVNRQRLCTSLTDVATLTATPSNIIVLQNGAQGGRCLFHPYRAVTS